MWSCGVILYALLVVSLTNWKLGQNVFKPRALKLMHYSIVSPWKALKLMRNSSGINQGEKMKP